MTPKKITEKLLSQQRRLDLKEKELEFRKTFLTTITGALTFVAGLFWRDAINSYLDLLPLTQGIIGKTISAITVTAIFVIIILYLSSKTKKIELKLEKEKKKLEEKS